MTQKSSPKLSWRKRFAITGLVLFTLYLCFGIWAVPAILIAQIQSKGSEALGREVTVERASFNPFSLEAKLYGIEIGPEQGGSGKLLEIGKLSANPQLSSVFGTITVKSIEVSDGDVWVRVDSSGRFNFQDILDAQPSAPEPDPEATGEMPAVIVKNLLLSQLRLHYADSSLATPYEETVAIETFAGRDIGTVEKSGIEDANTGEPVYHWDFDGVIATGSGARLNLGGGALSLAPWTFSVKTELSDFPLESLQPYVDESVLAKLEGRFGFDLIERIEILEAGPAIKVSGGLGIQAFSLADAEQRFAAWDALTVSGIEIDATAMTLSVKEIAYESPVFEAILQADGSPRLPVMKSRDSTDEPTATAQDPMDFEASLESVALSNGRIAIEDRSTASPFKTDVDGIELKISNVKAKQAGGEYDSSGVLSLALNLLGGRLELEAGLQSLQGLAEATLSLQDLQLKNLQPYVSEYANAEVQDGRFSLDLAGQAHALAEPNLNASLGIKSLKVRQAGTQKEIVTLESMDVAGVEFSGDKVKIDSVTLVEPVIAAWQDELGINFSRIAKLEEDVEERTEEIEQETGMLFEIGRFELKSAGVGFVDTTLVSTHSSQVSDFDLVVQGLTTVPDRLASFEFSGVVDGSARIAGKGALSVADPGKHLDFDMSFRGYDLTSTSPYWATYLGRKLSKGQFEIISSYEVRDNQLKGSNDFKIDQLTLGEKVESDRAINLPLGFAIKLMQDPSGLISYDGLPVEGDLSDPQVKPWGLVGKAFRNLILNAVASPLKFLAKLAGGREDLDSIEFSVAQVELDQSGLEKVDALRKVMASRLGLKLEASFLPGPEEEMYLKDQYAMHRLANPEFQVVSGLDLLRPVDAAALESAARNRYAALVAASEVGESPDASTKGSDASASETVSTKATKQSEAQPGLVKRFARFIGLSKADASASEVSVAKSGSTEPSTAAATSEGVEQGQGPRLEEMLAAVLESMPQVTLDKNWMEDIAAERIRNFKTALLEGEAIDANRVFSSEVNEVDAKGALGSIQIRLTD